MLSQYTGETLGQSDKTLLDPGLEALLARADATKIWTDKMISQTEVLLQPNAGQTDAGVDLVSYYISCCVGNVVCLNNEMMLINEKNKHYS